MSPTGSLLLLAVVWAAPAWAVEPTPGDSEGEELPDAAPAPMAPPAADLPPVPTVVLGANLGAALPLMHLGPSVAPGLEAGVVVDDGGRFTVLLGLGYSGGTATGTGTDPAFPDGYDWSVTLRALQLTPAFRWRVLPWGEPLSPEVAAGPLLILGDAVATGSAGGAAFPETREARVAPGGFVSGGLVGRVGPGTLEGRVTFSLTHVDGALTGPAFIPAVTPAIGYRVER